MKAITLHQPWATLVAIGAKCIETRNWPTRYRGPLAIHAAKTFPGEDATLCERSPFREALGRPWDALPLGAVVAIADLVDCVRMTEENIQWVPADERRFGHYEPGRYIWILANVRLLDKPVPARGRQGLWEWDGGDS